MFDRRKTLKILTSIGGAHILTACVTRKLFEDRTYGERVSSVLISKDERKLVILTKDYHYVFDATPMIVSTLKGAFHQSISANFGTLVVNPSGAVSISFKLSLAKEASDADKQEAIRAGYLQTKNGGIYTEGELRGVRYAAGGVVPPELPTQLNKEYLISVVIRQGPGEKAAKTLLTPITVTTDGVLILAGIPLLAIMVGLLAFTCRNNRCK